MSTSAQDVADFLARWDEASDRSMLRIDGPTISLICAVGCDRFDPTAFPLLDSLKAQTYRNWELILVGIAQQRSSGAPGRDARIARRLRGDETQELDAPPALETRGAALRTASAHCSGRYLIVADAFDRLAAHALETLALSLESSDQAAIVYADHEQFDPETAHVTPVFKPDWSPDALLHRDYIFRPCMVSRKLVLESGGYRDDLDGACEHELLLRLTRNGSTPAHVSEVLYHHDAMRAPSHCNHAEESAAVVAQHLHDSGETAARIELFQPGRQAVASLRVDFDAGSAFDPPPLDPRGPRVSVIVPFKDGVDLLRSCVEGLLERTDYANFELMLVSNNSAEIATHRYLSEIAGEPRVRVMYDDSPFNYSAINNAAARKATGDLLLFLNNDMDVIDRDWLGSMAGWASRRESGAVGSLLLYPDGTVQHAGVVVGIRGYASHPFSGRAPTETTAFGQAAELRNVSAVTGACLMVRRDRFELVEGFDERFVVCGSDVDLCLRLSAHGYRSLVLPWSRLYHHESASRGTYVAPVDFAESTRAYSEVLSSGDPYYNPNLTLEDESCGVARPAPESPDVSSAPSVGKEHPWKALHA